MSAMKECVALAPAEPAAASSTDLYQRFGGVREEYDPWK
jgi:hypothetical protein